MPPPQPGEANADRLTLMKPFTFVTDAGKFSAAARKLAKEANIRAQ